MVRKSKVQLCSTPSLQLYTFFTVEGKNKSKEQYQMKTNVQIHEKEKKSYIGLKCFLHSKGGHHSQLYRFNSLRPKTFRGLPVSRIGLLD